tara:strand:- start:42 stop:542 length:501 start_codon:yes stop_codon:yes gene_type:complete
MIDIFGNEQCRPLKKYGKIIPNYYIFEDGSIIHSKSNKIRKPVTRSDGYQMVCISIPKDLFDDFDYYLQEGRNTPTMNVYIHKTVADTFMPIDENPPKQLKDTWNDVPEVWRQWVRDTAQVDHLDDDKSNNHVSNLEYKTPQENNIHRKEVKMGYTRDIHAHRRIK